MSESAQNYFRHLLLEQEVEGMGLRLQVLNPGTPKADCDLQFCPPGGAAADDVCHRYGTLELFVAATSALWLQDAQIDFETTVTGGQLTIKAPNIKGHTPADEAPLRERVQWVLDTEVNPGLAAHGGRVSLEGLTGEGAVVLRFGGGCHGCGMVDFTLKEGIEKTLRSRFPEITGVLDATDHATGENPYYA